MGNIVSSASTRDQRAYENNYSTMEIPEDPEEDNNEQFHDVEDSNDEDRAKAQEEEMNEFKKQLSIKREQRKEILARHKAEKLRLQKSLKEEKESNLNLNKCNKLLQELLISNGIEIPQEIKTIEEINLTDTIIQMKNEFEDLKNNNNKLRKDLAETNVALQHAYSDMADLSVQNTESIKHINALKQVISVSKTMINLREEQLLELKNKLSEIETSLADREANMLSTDLRQEYERQLQNIRTLRGLYEERARLAEVTRQGLVRDLEEQRNLYQAEKNKSQNLVKRIEELEDELNLLKETIENKNDMISSNLDETRGLKEEMSVVNKLFSQVLLGYKTRQDLDQLAHRLEENHGLLTHMAEKENGSEISSALPKLLLELVNQVDECEKKDEIKSNESTNNIYTNNSTLTKENSCGSSPSNPITTAEEIVQNLPKVWRVLMELLSHQAEPDVNIVEKVSTCYKSVDTKSGPVLVPSVSQTYIRLKDLILEKLTLVKEVNRMKQLNSHLETRLEEQERRLCLVSTELSKTWHVVGRLRRHHHQLHTHEKILKYELQQKRKLLNEIKEELEYCREKWEQAREKNSQSEKDWRKLRAEFSNRKIKQSSPLNTSAESGYSDEKPSDESSNDESEYIAEPQTRCKKLKKSFETIVDSSSDFNLAAEREDPASEMLDVAELPLDTQEDENQDVSVSDSCKSDNLLKNDIFHDETEDETIDINADICENNTSKEEENCTVKEKNVPLITTNCQPNLPSSSETPVINTAEIIENIRKQNERLAKKDQKLENLEKKSEALLLKTKNTVNLSNQLNDTLNHILNRPSSSTQCDNNGTSSIDIDNTNSCQNLKEHTDLNAHNQTERKEVEHSVNANDSLKDRRNSILENETGTIANDEGQHLNLENVNCNEQSLLSNNFEDDIEDSSFSNVNDSPHTNVAGPSNATNTNLDLCEPSTSNDLNHEARFAARDLRLRRLEEQTKSLVNKVNKTNSKGIKIHYKLEELHNIYGSENSRAGTPCEESEDKNSADESKEE